MDSLDPEPFGKPTLLLGSSLLSSTNDTATFTSNGLLDTGVTGGSSDSQCEWEGVPPAQNLRATRSDRDESTNGDEVSAFASNGLLDDPTQVTSTFYLFLMRL
jgi:hypothetical protein